MLNPLRSLEKKHVASVLETLTTSEFLLEQFFPKKTKALPEQALLDVFTDGTSPLKLKYRAACSLIDKESIRFVPLLLEFVNEMVDTDLDIKENSGTGEGITEFQYLLGRLKTPEAYEGTKKFLHRLLTADLKHKDIFIDGTIISLTNISHILNRKDAIPLVKLAMFHRLLTADLKHKDIFIDGTIISLTNISHILNRKDAIPLVKLAMFHFVPPINEGLISVAENFWAMNEPSLLKHILMQHVTSEMPDVEQICLEFLEDFDPGFTKEWQAQKENTNTQNEESE